jgi:Xaa-Pro aminopeptidase
MTSKETTRTHDATPPSGWTEFMKTGWAPSPLEGVSAIDSAPFTKARREALSQKFPSVRLVIPAGGFKVRSNDTDYRFRAHSAYSWLTGITATDALPDSVLILEPQGDSHEALLFVHPRSSRESDEFFLNARHGEFWVGRRMTVAETQVRYGITVRHIDTLKEFLDYDGDTYVLRGLDELVDKKVKERKKRDEELAVYLSEARLIKDSFEINELQKAVDTTNRGFADMVRVFPAATATSRGERIIEAAFFGRARLEGNELGYDSIVAAGSHACVLHWIRNDGDVKPGDLILIDAGAEMESLYTADITRTLPVNGKFTETQRRLYMLVYEAQRAGFAAVKPGAKFKDINRACQEVLAKGLEELGVLPVSAEESMQPESGLHRRWTVHGVSHMLGMDVHDCAQARKDQYADGTLAPGMVLTVEPGLYIHPDDELFPEQYRGIGIRIEDDVLVTETGCRVLSKDLPSHPDEIEVWMSNLAQARG